MSDDDDAPAGRRKVVRAAQLSSSTSSSSGGGLPDWVAQHQAYTKGKEVVRPEDSSDDDDVQLVEEQPRPLQGPTAEEAGPSQTKPGPRLPASRQQPVKAAASTQKAAHDTGQSEGAAAAVPGPSKPPAQSAFAAVPEAGQGEVAVVLPEKLAGGKVLVELEPLTTGATDLTGDSGAVGRVQVIKTAGGNNLQLDLKGVLYNATVVQSAATLCVVNIGQTEARVEAVMNDFIRLREVPVGGDDVAGTLDRYFMDDDDNYQVTGAAAEGAAAGSKQGGAAAAAADAKGKKKAAAAKPKAAGRAVKSGKRSNLKSKGGVKKRSGAGKKSSKSSKAKK